MLVPFEFNHIRLFIVCKPEDFLFSEKKSLKKVVNRVYSQKVMILFWYKVQQ